MAADQSQLPLDQRKLSDLTDYEVSSPQAVRHEQRSFIRPQVASLTQELKTEEASKRPLVGELEPLERLSDEYKNKVFLSKIASLNRDGWTDLRRLRGDGDCFYREFVSRAPKMVDAHSLPQIGAFAFSYLERLLPLPSTAAQLALAKIESLLPLLDQAGFMKDMWVFWNFSTPVSITHACSATATTTSTSPFATSSSLSAQIPNSLGRPLPPCTPPSTMPRPPSEFPISCFHPRLTSRPPNSAIIVFLRLLTSAFLRANADDYTPFLFGLEDDPRFFEGGAPTMDQFCGFHVEVSFPCPSRVAGRNGADPPHRPFFPFSTHLTGRQQGSRSHPDYGSHACSFGLHQDRLPRPVGRASWRVRRRSSRKRGCQGRLCGV
jgi:ubiquitin thioesterase protein OTUB1